MKKMKRLGVLILALALAWSLTACGGSRSSGTSVLPALSGGSGASASSAGSSDGGYSEGRLGDVMRTYFFAFTVNSVYTCDSIGDFAPEEGKQVLVAEVSVKNTFTESLPMFDTDFQIQWNDKEDPDNAYASPISANFSDELLPETYELAVDEQVTGLLAFEVPADEKDYSLVYLEEFDDDTTGDFYAVYFTAKPQDGTV